MFFFWEEQLPFTVFLHAGIGTRPYATGGVEGNCIEAHAFIQRNSGCFDTPPVFPIDQGKRGEA